MIQSAQTLAHSRRFRLAEIPQPIEIHIWKDLETNSYISTASHSIRTPMQINADLPQPSPRDKSPEAAADTVMNFYRSEYRQAIEAGLLPSSNWLIRE